MKQITAKTVLEVLEWVETHQHHSGAVTEKGHFVLAGYHSKITIPKELTKIAIRYMEPTRYPFDSRMYRATPYGIRMLGKAGRMDHVKEVQKIQPRIRNMVDNF